MRIIHFSNESGSKEGVFFTDDDSALMEDILPYGCSLSNEVIISEDFPATFPTDYILWRE